MVPNVVLPLHFVPFTLQIVTSEEKGVIQTYGQNHPPLNIKLNAIVFSVAIMALCTDINTTLPSKHGVLIFLLKKGIHKKRKSPINQRL